MKTALITYSYVMMSALCVLTAKHLITVNITEILWNYFACK